MQKDSDIQEKWFRNQKYKHFRILTTNADLDGKEIQAEYIKLTESINKSRIKFINCHINHFVKSSRFKINFQLFTTYIYIYWANCLYQVQCCLISFFNYLPIPLFQKCMLQVRSWIRISWKCKGNISIQIIIIEINLNLRNTKLPRSGTNMISTHQWSY